MCHRHKGNGGVSIVLSSFLLRRARCGAGGDFRFGSRLLKKSVLSFARGNLDNLIPLYANWRNTLPATSSPGNHFLSKCYTKGPLGLFQQPRSFCDIGAALGDVCSCPNNRHAPTNCPHQFFGWSGAQDSRSPLLDRAPTIVSRSVQLSLSP